MIKINVCLATGHGQDLRLVAEAAAVGNAGGGANFLGQAPGPAATLLRDLPGQDPGKRSFPELSVCFSHRYPIKVYSKASLQFLYR